MSFNYDIKSFIFGTMFEQVFVAMKQDETGKYVPLSLDGALFKMQAKGREGDLIFEASSENGKITTEENKITIRILKEETELMNFESAKYDILKFQPGKQNEAKRFVFGTIFGQKAVTSL